MNSPKLFFVNMPHSLIVALLLMRTQIWIAAEVVKKLNPCQHCSIIPIKVAFDYSMLQND